MLTEYNTTSTNIKEILAHIESLLLHTWQETGFGCLTIESDRPKDKKIRIIIKGGTHYRYVISDEEIKHWVIKNSSRIEIYSNRNID
jgi:hypothetical protein